MTAVDIDFRALTIDDLAALRHISPDTPTEKLVERINRQSPSTYSYIGAFSHNRLLGAIQVRRIGPYDATAQSLSTYPELGCLVVTESQRGKGYGKALIAYAEAILKHEHFTGAGLGVAETNQAALALYRKLGYQPIGAIGPKHPDPTNRQYYIKLFT